MTGPQGPAGAQGIQGPAGQVLVVDGGVVVGPPGASVVVTPVAAGGQPCPAGGVRITQLSDGGITHLCHGATGAVGPTGASGPIGMTGPQGPQGTQGPQGAVGPAGATGPQGPQGAAGPAGAVGPAGAQGVPGASVSAVTLPVMSPACVTGGVQLRFPDGGTLAVCNGATGAAGALGPTGPAGASGATGATGAAGATGSPGPAGPSGATGPAGPPGPPGPALYLDGGVATAPAPKLVGYTTATSTANLGGLFGANAKCRAQFPGSTFCSLSDFQQAELDSTSAPPAGGAWIDEARDVDGQRASSSCSAWTAASTYSVGLTVTATGTGNEYCNVQRPLACCSVPVRAAFRGITTATFTANLGGQLGANSKCRAEFPGSTFCTLTDVRASELSAFPSASAWVDEPRDAQGRRASSSCSAWSAASSYSVGLTLTPTGTGNEYCNVLRPLACCQ